VSTIFVLMLENRSFDHLFGYSGIVGRDVTKGKIGLSATEVDGLLGKPPFTNANPLDRKNPVPTSPTADYRIPAPKSDPYHKSGDPPHEFMDVMQQLCGPAGYIGPNLPSGEHDARGWQGYKDMQRTHKYPPILDANERGFVTNYVGTYTAGPAEVPMQCFDPDDLPILTGLAREYVICDNWFAAMPGPTWSNRFWVHGASPTRERFTEDPSGTRIVEAEERVGAARFGYRNGTIWDRLASARLLGLGGFDGPNAICQMENALVVGPAMFANGAIYAMLKAGTGLPGWGFPSYVFIEPNFGSQGPDIPLGLNACRQPPIAGDDMHPARDVRPAEQFVRRVYEAIRNSPKWPRSALLILFDEHGGFFDHVKPPAGVNPNDGKPNAVSGFNFDQLGVRVPCIVISPWVKKNGIDHTHYDHSSVPATVTRNFGLRHLTDRDLAANDVLHLFSNSAPRTNTPASLQALDVHALDPTKANTWVGDFTGVGDGRDELLYFDGGLPSVTAGLHIGNTHDWWVGRWEDASGTDRKSRIAWTLIPQVGGHRFDVSQTGKFAVYTGRFSGGPNLELIVYAKQTGQWWLGRFGNGQLTWTQVSKIPLPPFPLQPKAYVGRFTPNAIMDELAVYEPAKTSWSVASLSGNTLTFSSAVKTPQLGSLAGAQVWVGTPVYATSGLLVHTPGLAGLTPGSWWLVALDGTNPPLIQQQPGQPKELSQLTNLPVWSGNFTGAQETPQLLIYSPTAQTWWLAWFAGTDHVFTFQQLRPVDTAGRPVISSDFVNSPPLTLTGDFDANGNTQVMTWNSSWAWWILRVDSNAGTLVFDYSREHNRYGNVSGYPFWSLHLSGQAGGNAGNAAQLLFYSLYDGHWGIGTFQNLTNQTPPRSLVWAEARNKAAASV
jgi:phospholipase C